MTTLSPTTPALQAGVNRVTFASRGAQLAGDLHLPNGFDASATYPTIVYSGPFNQVKEQTGAVYGAKLAAQGFVYLAFDHVGYGDSEGQVRNFEQGFDKMENIRDAISYLGTLPFVDRDRLFGLGVCASGGYMPIVAATDKRLKAIATVSGMMDNVASYFGAMSRDQLIPLFEMANAARQKAYETGEVDYYDALGMESLDLDDLDPTSGVAEGYDFYMTERAGAATYPNYSHLAPAMLMESAPLTSATALAPYLYTPYLGIIGADASDTGPLTQAFYAAASEPKELYEVPGATHVSLYDIDEHVDQAVDRMVEFFTKHGSR